MKNKIKNRTFLYFPRNVLVFSAPFPFQRATRLPTGFGFGGSNGHRGTQAAGTEEWEGPTKNLDAKCQDLCVYISWESKGPTPPMPRGNPPGNK